MSDQPMPAKTPDELLQEQIDLLKVNNKYQNSIFESQLKAIEIQSDWQKLIIEEQRKQTSHLKTISLAATIYIILVILGVCLSVCIGSIYFVQVLLP
jgi:hypothetical protein